MAMQTSDLILSSDMADLAPMIPRQRLVVEGRCPEPISDVQIREYLRALSDVCEMDILLDPITHCSDLYGWAGWVHWKASGAHFYAWEQPLLFFSVDLYTCKVFDPNRVVSFTQSFFNAQPIVAKSF